MSNTKTPSADVLTLEQSKALVDEWLVSLFQQRSNQAGNLDPYYQDLWQSIITLYSAGGKRLRPYITTLSYYAFGGTNDDIVKAASATELLHQAMLIHDDIIDRDTIRYGVKNITGQYQDSYSSLISNVPERRHFSESAALLAGDLLISEAHMQIALSEFSSNKIVMAQKILYDAVFRVAGGELIDTEASFRPPGSIDPLSVALQKTASYSFVTPLILGASLADASSSEIDTLREIGEAIGIGFQLRDDLIGIFGDEAITGKSTDGDLREGKQTMLINEFFKRADKPQKARFDLHFGNKQASVKDIQVLRDLIEQSGTRDAVEGFIASYHIKATEHLADLNISISYKTAFEQLIQKCMVREK